MELAEIAVSTLTFWANNPPLVRTFFRVVHGGGVHLHLIEVHVVIVNVVQPKVKSVVIIFIIVLLASEVGIPELRRKKWLSRREVGISYTVDELDGWDGYLWVVGCIEHISVLIRVTVTEPATVCFLPTIPLSPVP